MASSLVKQIWSILCILNVFYLINSSVFCEKTNAKKKIVIIGAGASGLCAARHAISEGYDVSIFEQTDHVGGTWAYTDRTGNDDYGLPSLGTVYKSLLTNAPIETMGYPDYDFQSNNGSYVSHVEVRQFLESYANHFNLTSVIKFGHYVLRVAPASEGDQWEVVVKNLKSDSYDVLKSDFIFVCNGLFHVPNLPKIPGMDQFTGTQLHSRDYRTPERFENEKVLMIGSGPSGIDITRDVATKAGKVLFSTHDHHALIFPANVLTKPDVAEIKPNSVLFVDGTEHNITAIIYCTGYKYSYPFLSVDSGVSLKSTEHVYPLYKHTININKPTIAFIGLQLLTFTSLIFDLQVRFALSVWSGHTTLPTKQEMLEDTEKFVQKQWKAGFKQRQGHLLAFETENYCRELAKISGNEALPDVYFKLFNIILEKFIKEPNTFRQYNYKITSNSTYEVTALSSLEN